MSKSIKQSPRSSHRGNVFLINLSQLNLSQLINVSSSFKFNVEDFEDTILHVAKNYNDSLQLEARCPAGLVGILYIFCPVPNITIQESYFEIDSFIDERFYSEKFINMLEKSIMKFIFNDELIYYTFLSTSTTTFKFSGTGSPFDRVDYR